MSQASDPESSVLIVCHANICRSPLAEFLLSPALASWGWDVRSAGTHARDGTGICARVHAALADQTRGPDFSRSFVSHALTEDDMHAALILTASTAEKSTLARRDHTTRRRTFTLREAAALADSEDSDGLRQARWPAAAAARLDELRRAGTVRLSSGIGSFDIDDPHRGQRTSHGVAMTEITDAVDRLSRGLRPSTA